MKSKVVMESTGDTQFIQHEPGASKNKSSGGSTVGENTTPVATSSASSVGLAVIDGEGGFNMCVRCVSSAANDQPEGQYRTCTQPPPVNQVTGLRYV